MQGQFYIVNSQSTLENAQRFLAAKFDEHKFMRVRVDGGKRTLPQNALKAVWYGVIASKRDDVTAKDVERECKYKYGLPILRRHAMHEYVFANAVDPLDYERRIKVMDCFKVTSDMSVNELTEYLNMMQSDYPFLQSNKA